MTGWPKVGPRDPHTLPPMQGSWTREGQVRRGAFPGRPMGGGDRGGGVGRQSQPNVPAGMPIGMPLSGLRIG